MARIKLSSLVNEISGSVNGTTFQNSVAGPVMRNKPNPCNTQTAFQCVQRNALSKVLYIWQNLVDSNKEQWNSYTAYYNKFQKNNKARLCKGQDVFTSVNCARLLQGLGLLLIPVYNFGLLNVFNAILTQDNSSFSFEMGREIDPDIEYIELFMTPPLSVGLMTAPNKYKHIPIVTPNDTQLNILSEYEAVFGCLPSARSSCFFKIRIIDKYSGITLPFQFGKNLYIEN